jgi:ABC-2 type transport system ATP-binding protein
VNIAMLAVIAIAAVAFEAFCLVHLYRAREVRYLPKWAWAGICLISIPLGGIVYLSVGAVHGHAPRDHSPRASPDEGTSSGEVRSSVPLQKGRAAAIEIEIDRLTKRFGSVTALDDLSFTVAPGRVTGFLGPNGAGKSTTMRVILGLDAPTTGRVLVGGRRYNEIIRPLHQVGSLLDANALHAGRSAWRHIQSVAQSNGIGKRRIGEVLALTGLEDVAHRRVGTFSLGMKQRLGIALALLGAPPVLVFDEPVNGLDPEGVHWLRQLFKTLAAEGRTIFVSSHLMSEMALTADHLIIIGRGRLLADTPIDRFVQDNARSDVLVGSPQADALAHLLAAHHAEVTAEGEQRLAVSGLDAPAIADLAAEHTIPVYELTPRHATLEQAYLDLTEASVDYRAGQGVESHG